MTHFVSEFKRFAFQMNGKA